MRNQQTYCSGCGRTRREMLETADGARVCQSCLTQKTIILSEDGYEEVSRSDKSK